MFHPLRTKEIQILENDLHIWAVKNLFVNFYVVGTPSSKVVFDTGVLSPLASLGLKTLGLKTTDISSVFLTHSDFDHVGGLNLFKNADIYLSEKEGPLIDHEKARRFIIYNRRIKNAKRLKDREVIHIDPRLDVQMIDSPGHTLGSCLYLVNDRYLFTGDTIRLQRGEIKPFMFLQNMDHAQDKRTVERLTKEGIFDTADVILTAHSALLNRQKT